MLKGHVFSRQLFGHPIFALFINTFLNGKNGVSNNYKNGMLVTYSGNTVTVDGGAVCIQGRFLEEDTSSQIVSGTDTAYCKLVIEIDLDKQNTESDFTQASYKIVKSGSGYPNLTQTDIVKNNSGIYQYELARFRTNASGIFDFKDMRTFLDFNSIYDAMQSEYRSILTQLQQELNNVEDGSAYLLKTKFVTEANTDLNDYRSEGTFYFSSPSTPLNIPVGVNGWLEVIAHNENVVKQIWRRFGTANTNDYQTYVRTYINGTWSNWTKYKTDNDFAVITGTMQLDANTQANISASPIKFVKTGININYPAGFAKDNCVVISVMFKKDTSSLGYAQGWNNYPDSSDAVRNSLPYHLTFSNNIVLSVANMGTQSTTISYKIVLMKTS